MHSLKTSILDATNKGLDVFKHFLGRNFIQTNKAFKNPFYQDTKASCNVYFDKTANLYKFHDFGNSDYSGDCFNLVAKLYKLDCNKAQDFIQVLHVINEQLHLQLVTNERSTTRVHNHPNRNRDYVPTKTIQDQNAISSPEIESIPLFNPVQFKALSEDELAYWSSYGIGIGILNRYQVKAIQQLIGINKEGKNYTIRYSSQEPMYGYQGGNTG